jgi:hypothetical protein
MSPGTASQAIGLMVERREQNSEDLMVDKTWGDKRVVKRKEMLRIGIVNVGGMTTEKRTNSKMEEIHQYVSKLELDIVGFSECNVMWNNVPAGGQLREQTRGWWKTIQINTAYYSGYQTKAKSIAGGVSLWSIDTGAHRITSQGRDESGLGRWAWTRYKGKSEIHIRVIMGYRPVLNKTGPLSTWNQQKGFFLNQDEDRCPRDMFTSDIGREIELWLAMGDQLVLGLDTNEDIYSGVFSRAMAQLGLTEAITNAHGDGAPATYKRGSKPIDGIYVTPGLLGYKCGYDKFVWDHRLLWIDIPWAAAFGSTRPVNNKRKERRLVMEDPRIVARYLDAYAKYIEENGLLERAEALMESSSYPPTRATKAEYDDIDKLRLMGMVTADRACRKVKMGAHQWSPKYQNARNNVALWRLVVKKKLGGKVSSRFLSRQMTICSRPEAMRTTIEVATMMRNNAYRIEKALAKKSISLRKTWLVSLCEAKAAAGQGAEEAILRNTLRIEEERRNARLIRAVNNKLRAGGVSSVTVQDEAGNLTEWFLKEDIERALCNENHARFNQAQDTPFLQAPLFEKVGRLGISLGARQILNGNFQIPEGTDEWAAKLIPFLARHPAVGSETIRPTTVSLESHCDGWRKAKEFTSSGPSGINFAHFKAGATDELVAQFEATMTSIPYNTGISPKRWQKGTNVMLEKQKGNNNVAKLRAILLYEADFNQNNKKLGREMMYTAEDIKAIAMEQYGSRAKLSAGDHSLNKRLTFDLMRQSKRPGAMCSNDAKSCYDRIVHSVASLAMQRLGVAEAPIVCMFTTIQNLEHKIRTVFGDSTIGFTGALWAVPIQGVGQGNGAGPQIWAAVSTPVLNMLRAEGHGAFFKAAISGEEISFVGYAFVDDTDLVTTGKRGNFEFIAKEAQEALTAWEGGIRATGGAIVPEKSHWYLIDFVWKNGNWKYATIEETPASISVRDCHGAIKQLERLPIAEARRTLGVRLAPDGNNQAEFENLCEKAKSWADNVRTGHLPRHLVWQSMNTTLLPSIKYPLPSTTLTLPQCRKIASIVLQAGLPGSGIARTFPRDLVMAPIRFQGLGLPCLYTAQKIEHILRILKFCNAKEHITGRLIRQSVEATKLEIGYGGPLFHAPFNVVGILATPTWITHTWEYLVQQQMRISDTGPELALSRENDALLIPMFIKGGIAGNNLKRLNLCRMFLKAVTVADITTGCGKYITGSAWEGRRDDSRESIYEWAAQGNPSGADWVLWRTSLSLLADNRRLLQQPLGRWLPGRTGHKWYFDQASERLYCKDGEAVTLHSRLPGRASTRFSVRRFQRVGTKEESIPASAWPTSIEIQRSIIVITGSCEKLSAEVSTNSSFRDFVNQRDKQQLWAIESFVSSDEGLVVADAIRTGDCIGVSDGSYKDEFGTAAWIIQGKDEIGSISGVCVVPGNSTDQSAYRSELAGLYAIITMIEAVCIFHKIEKGVVTIGCDGLSALRQGLQASDITNPAMAQFDIIAAIRNAMMRSPVKWNKKHIKGHQDADPNATLDRWALLNIAMDVEAKALWLEKVETRQTQRDQIFGEPWALWIGKRKVSNNVHEAVTNHVSGTKAMEYWKEKGRFKSGKPEDIDWDIVQATMKAQSRNRRHWVVKHATGFCGVNKMMLRWKQRVTDECPRCSEVETTEHVWKCTGEGANAVWDKSIEELRKWLKAQGTLPNFNDLICDRLSAWRYSIPYTVEPSNCPGLKRTVEQQEKLGWRCLLEGFPVKGWAEIQEAYYGRKGSRRSGKRWLVAVLKKLSDIAWDQWEHRNGILHDKETGTRNIEREGEIREQFTIGLRTVMVDDRHFLEKGVDVVLEQSPEVQEAWLIRVIASRGRHGRIYEQRDGYTQERTGIYAWLGRA